MKIIITKKFNNEVQMKGKEMQEMKVCLDRN